jgi:flagellar hook-associated protein 3 FlgL
MRVIETMIFSQGVVGINAAREREEQAVIETSTGARVTHPGDDPAAAGQVVVHRLAAERMDAIQTTLGRASDELGTADGALDSLANIVSRARELAVQLSNDSYSGNDRAAGASEIQGLLGNAIAALNTRVGNRYIFGGNRDGAAPFDATGAYLGDTGVRQIEIAPGVLQDASIRADVMAKGVGGGVDVLATLSALQTAMATNDANGIRGTLDNLDGSIAQIARGRAQTGTAMNVIDSAGQAASTAVMSEKKTISGLADADIIDSATKLAQAQQALDAALTATAKSFNLSLVDKLA